MSQHQTLLNLVSLSSLLASDFKTKENYFPELCRMKEEKKKHEIIDKFTVITHP